MVFIISPFIVEAFLHTGYQALACTKYIMWEC
jgi:hypothetical protein